MLWYPCDASFWRRPNTTAPKTLHLPDGVWAACGTHAMLDLEHGESNPPIVRRCKQCQRINTKGGA